MKKLLDAIRLALDSKNWYAAIYLALTMPDICAKLESPGATGVGKRYKAWFDRYLKKAYTRDIADKTVIFLSSADCFALRCSVLHEGSDEIGGQKVRETLSKIYFTTTGHHRARIENTLTLDVSGFCRDVIAAVESWELDVASNVEVQSRIAEIIAIQSQAFSPVPGVVMGTTPTGLNHQ